MRVRQSRIGLFFSRVNAKYEDRDIYFKIGKNMYWIEMHVLNTISSNIEIGFSSGYTARPAEPLFDPFAKTIFDEEEDDRSLELFSGQERYSCCYPISPNIFRVEDEEKVKELAKDEEESIFVEEAKPQRDDEELRETKYGSEHRNKLQDFTETLSQKGKTKEIMSGDEEELSIGGSPIKQNFMKKGKPKVKFVKESGENTNVQREDDDDNLMDSPVRIGGGEESAPRNHPPVVEASIDDSLFNSSAEKKDEIIEGDGSGEQMNYEF